VVIVNALDAIKIVVSEREKQITEYARKRIVTGDPKQVERAKKYLRSIAVKSYYISVKKLLKLLDSEKL
jgi:malonyl CoA-acyl carrier protein transacylase